jgi:hypothetical protein
VGRVFPEVRQVFVQSMVAGPHAAGSGSFRSRGLGPGDGAAVGLVQGAAVQTALLEDFDAERYLRAIGDTLPG